MGHCVDVYNALEAARRCLCGIVGPLQFLSMLKESIGVHLDDPARPATSPDHQCGEQELADEMCIFTLVCFDVSVRVFFSCTAYVDSATLFGESISKSFPSHECDRIQGDPKRQF